MFYHFLSILINVKFWQVCSKATTCCNRSLIVSHYLREQGKMASHAAPMSLFHSQSTVGFHQRNLAPCSVSSARASLLRTIALDAYRSAPYPAMEAIPSRPSTRRNSSRSFNNESMAENFSDNDEDYADSSILEALEVRSGPNGCIIKMNDGRILKCAHNTTEGGVTPVYVPQPAIVLQLNDGSNLLLPIIVLQLPSTMLLDAVRNVQIMRPTVYQVVSRILEVSGYRAKLVRVTKRVNETYFARAYLVKDGDESAPPVSLDIRPSDAINLAVRCKIPIQVCNIFPFDRLCFKSLKGVFICRFLLRICCNFFC